MEEDYNPVEYCLTGILVSEVDKGTYIRLRSMYDFLEGLETDDPHESKINDLRLEILGAIQAGIIGVGTSAFEGSDLDDLSKCAASALWCRRMDGHIEGIRVTANEIALLLALLEVNFQDKNT